VDPYELFQIIQLFLRLLIYTLIGKMLLAWLAGARYRDNPVWRLFDKVTAPVRAAVRWLAPRAVSDRRLDLLAILLLLAINLVLYMVFYSQGWITPLQSDGGRK
jgi:uncharacterized protein YggT (Ycf19 family)